jgi:hypothetical protein
MKTIASLASRAFFLMLIAGVMTSCKKDKETKQMESADAADAVESSLTTKSAGLIYELEELIPVTPGYILPSGDTIFCNTQYDSTLSRNVNAGGFTGSYNVNWDYIINCNGLSIPQNMNMSMTTSGSSSTPRNNSTSSSTVSLTLTGLEFSATQIVVNGTASFSGSQTSRVRNQNTFTSNLSFNLSNLTFDKASQELLSGSATISMTGSVTDGDSYTFTGNVVFNGGGAATVTINGNSYTIDVQ